jgi:alkylated DNA repair dioxygenase AlkB
MLYYRSFESVPLIHEIEQFFNNRTTIRKGNFSLSKAKDTITTTTTTTTAITNIAADPSPGHESDFNTINIYENNPKENEDASFSVSPVIVNHIIGTKYIDGDDNIGFHSDKMKDIVDGSPIFMISMGEKRELHFRDASFQGIITDQIVMEPGSLFVLGPKTNIKKQHAIAKLSEEKVCLLI